MGEGTKKSLKICRNSACSDFDLQKRIVKITKIFVWRGKLFFA